MKISLREMVIKQGPMWDHCNITKEDGSKSKEKRKEVLLECFTWISLVEKMKYDCVGNLHNPTTKIFFYGFLNRVTKKLVIGFIRIV